MSGATSRLWTEVDFDKQGKQVGYLRLPHSTTRSAYGTIAIPISVIANGDGPSVLLMAGIHGDEYEAQIALCRLIRELEPEHVQGRIIVMPATNLPAAMAGTRVSPIDDLNLNRCFPGDPDGRPTEQIAYYIDSVLLPLCDVWLDLHSGGGSLAYVPFVSVHRFADEALNARNLAALKSFGSPYGIVWAFFDEPRMAKGCAERHGLLYLGSELGGGGSVNPEGVRLAYEGSLRTLRHVNALSPAAPFRVPEPVPTRLMEVGGRDYFVYAPAPGLFEPVRALTDTVERGARLGFVHFVDDPSRAPIAVELGHEGMIICMRHPGRVERGDCLAHVVTDLSPTES